MQFEIRYEFDNVATGRCFLDVVPNGSVILNDMKMVTIVIMVIEKDSSKMY